MQLVLNVVAWFQTHWPLVLQAYALVVTGLFILSEALALIPAVAANSVFQAIQNWLRSNQPPKP